VCWWCVRLMRLMSAVPLLVTLMTVVCCVLVMCQDGEADECSAVASDIDDCCVLMVC